MQKNRKEKGYRQNLPVSFCENCRFFSGELALCRQCSYDRNEELEQYCRVCLTNALIGAAVSVCILLIVQDYHAGNLLVQQNCICDVYTAVQIYVTIEGRTFYRFLAAFCGCISGSGFRRGVRNGCSGVICCRGSVGWGFCGVRRITGFRYGCGSGLAFSGITGFRICCGLCISGVTLLRQICTDQFYIGDICGITILFASPPNLYLSGFLLDDHPGTGKESTPPRT